MAGRPKGAKNKRTLEREAHARAMAALVTQALGEDAFDGDAHALLMAVSKNNQAPIHLHVDAAKVAMKAEVGERREQVLSSTACWQGVLVNVGREDLG